MAESCKRPLAEPIEFRWHARLPSDLATAWDNAWAMLDLHPFQHRELAETRAMVHGQSSGYMTGEAGGRLVFGGAMQIRSAWPWPPRFAFSRGPWAVDAETLRLGLTALPDASPFIQQPMAVRIDPHLPLPENNLDIGMQSSGYAIALPELHRHTVKIDLTLSEKQLLAGFRSLTRRHLRKSGSFGLTTRPGTAADIADYLALHRPAATRNHYGLQNPAWLHALMASGLGYLVISKAQGRMVGGAWFLAGSRTLHYLYGATDAEFAGPALYEAFWQALTMARGLGLTSFDLGGLPLDHPGIAFFKQGFGGQVCHFSEEWERVLRPHAYHSWQWVRQRRLFART
jgi:hypothetical protein